MRFLKAAFAANDCSEFASELAAYTNASIASKSRPSRRQSNALPAHKLSHYLCLGAKYLYY